MISLIVFLMVLGVLVMVHETGHFLMAKKLGVRAEKFALGFGPVLFKKQGKDTEYSIRALPLGGYVKLAGDSLEECKGNKYEYFAQAPGRRFWIIICGPLLNYILGFLFFWFIFCTGYPALTSKVGGLVEGLGAEAAGLKPGDRIVAVDQKQVALWEDLQEIVHSKKESDTVVLSIIRDGRQEEREVRIKETTTNDLLGQKRSVGLLGITAGQETVTMRHGPLASFGLALDKTWGLTTLTFKALFGMLTGKLSMKESVTGPLGIYYITSKAASMGIVALLHLVAVLSVSLAVFNILPFPVLDGGHILFLAVEKIRGKALSVKTERLIMQIGLSAIVTFALFVTYNDVVRLFGDKLSKIFQ